MANEERVGPNVINHPDRADEVQRRTDMPPARPPLTSDRMDALDRSQAAGAASATAAHDAAEASTHSEALFPSADIGRLRNQWTEIQAGFVDEPKSAVKRADALVGDVLKSLSDTFARERTKLESQWDHDGDVTTEDFRVAFQRYRTFFDRLLSI